MFTRRSHFTIRKAAEQLLRCDRTDRRFVIELAQRTLNGTFVEPGHLVDHSDKVTMLENCGVPDPQPVVVRVEGWNDRLAVEHLFSHPFTSKDKSQLFNTLAGLSPALKEHVETNNFTPYVVSIASMPKNEIDLRKCFELWGEHFSQNQDNLKRMLIPIQVVHMAGYIHVLKKTQLGLRQNDGRGYLGVVDGPVLCPDIHHNILRLKADVSASLEHLDGKLKVLTNGTLVEEVKAKHKSVLEALYYNHLPVKAERADVKVALSMLTLDPEWQKKDLSLYSDPTRSGGANPGDRLATSLLSMIPLHEVRTFQRDYQTYEDIKHQMLKNFNITPICQYGGLELEDFLGYSHAMNDSTVTNSLNHLKSKEKRWKRKVSRIVQSIDQNGNLPFNQSAVQASLDARNKIIVEDRSYLYMDPTLRLNGHTFKITRPDVENLITAITYAKFKQKFPPA